MHRSVTHVKIETSCSILLKTFIFFLWVRIIGNKDKHYEINMNAESNKVNLDQLFSGKT